jgi:hypothetical protein
VYVPAVGLDQDRTERDDSAARERTRNVWLARTLKAYVEACSTWRRDPRNSLRTLREVLEGWAYATRVETDLDFKPFKGQDLHAPPLGECLKEMKVELPAQLKNWVQYAKQQSDPAHHIKGADEPVRPEMVRFLLGDCAALLEWTYDDLLRTARPPELHQAKRELGIATFDGTKPTIELRPLHVENSPVVTVITPLPDTPPAPSPPAKTEAMFPSARGLAPPRQRRSSSFSALGVVVAVGLSLGALAAFLLLRSSAEGSAAPESPLATSPAPNAPRPLAGPPDDATVLGYVEAYAQALSARDVDAILRLHAFPARRFFLQKNYSEAALRSAYEGQLRKEAPGTTYEFKRCAVVHPANAAEVAVRCGGSTAADRSGGTCLVFTLDGRLLSRTELATFPACPPPPP